MWLYVVSPHWVKAIYLCFFLTPAISPSTPLGVQIKEGLIVYKAKGLTELWTPAADRTILFVRVR